MKLRRTPAPTQGRRERRGRGAGCGALLCLWVATAPVAAQQPSVRAYLNTDQAPVGGRFALNVEIVDAQRADTDPSPPDLTGIARFLSAGTQTSFRMSGGRTTMSLTYQYWYQALAEGAFEIPAVEVSVGGRTLRTEPLTLLVSGATAPDVPEAGPLGAVGPEDFFVEARADATQVYENQAVMVEYRMFARVDVNYASITTQPSTEGFWAEELASGDVSVTVRNGLQYATRAIRRWALFPTGPGRRTLAPLGVEGTATLPRARSRDPFADLFSIPDLLGSQVPVSALSDSLAIEALPLPSAGRPASFGGHVGTLEATAAVDKNSVEADEAVTFRLTLSGTGNIRSLAFPAIDFPAEFEVFPPEITDDVGEGPQGLQGSRTYEYVLVPRTPGNLVLPAVEVAYFDPERRTYRQTRTTPMDIAVAAREGAVSSTPTRTSAAVESLRDEIRFILTGDPGLRRRDRSLLSSAPFWIAILLPVAAVAGAAAARRRRERLEGDVSYARTRRARRVAKKRLARARAAAHGDSREFHAEVGGALLGFVADKLNIAEAGFERGEASCAAREKGVRTETLERLFACLDHCDRERFAPSAQSNRSHDELLQQAAELMNAFAQELES